ncbi:hypothetical protein [Sphaerisporangium aureirubrum]|uniref:Uncharacterized protein n=1 Tax=Sphaerisporangium aureirubrum TaxID=1544736 RepID=A0ABW1N9N1_9ACTN
MAVTLNKRAFDFAKKLIADGHRELDENGDWSDHQPSADQENKFLEKHDFAEYAKWHLGEDDEHPEDTKGRYKFPYGDFKKVHRCGVIAAKARAAQRDHDDIEDAAARLLDKLDKLMEK